MNILQLILASLFGYVAVVTICKNRYAALALLLLITLYSFFFPTSHHPFDYIKVSLCYLVLFFMVFSRFFPERTFFPKLAAFFIFLNIASVGLLELSYPEIMTKLNGVIGCLLSIYILWKIKYAYIEKSSPHRFLFELSFPLIISYSVWDSRFLGEYLDEKFLFFFILLSLPTLHSIIRQDSKIFAFNRAVTLGITMFASIVFNNFEFPSKYLLYNESLTVLSLKYLSPLSLGLSVVTFIFLIVTSLQKENLPIDK